MEREGDKERERFVWYVAFSGFTWLGYSRNTMPVIPPARHILKESSKLA